jgi:hypothetical protein
MSINHQSSLSDEQITSFNKSMNKESQIYVLKNDMQSKINQSQATPGVFGELNSLIGTVWNTFKNIYTSVAFTTDTISDTPKFIPGLPLWIPALIIAIIIVTIAFIIFSAIFQRDL